MKIKNASVKRLERKLNQRGEITTVLIIATALFIAGLVVGRHSILKKSKPAHLTKVYHTYNISLKKPDSLVCSVSAYTNHPSECNKDNNHTAIMEKPIAGGTCAVSRDLIHWLGGIIYIKGIGVFRVNDLMNERFTKSVDLYIGSKKEANKFGRKPLMVVFLGR